MACTRGGGDTLRGALRDTLRGALRGTLKGALRGGHLKGCLKGSAAALSLTCLQVVSEYGFVYGPNL